MIRRLFTVLAAVATVAAVALTTATPALADDFYRWGETSRSFYHYGNPALGSFGTRIWVDDWDDDTDGDGLPDRELIRAHARICKGTHIARAQVDRVRLVDTVTGAIVRDRLTPVNSGTAPCAEAATDWLLVDPFSCPDAHPYRADGFFSGRWSDGTLTKVSYRGDPSEFEWCRSAAGTVVRQETTR